jgi:hypothetical protein
MAGLFEIVNLLSVLLVGRKPEWKLQPALTALPTTVAAGVALGDSPRAALHIALREELHRKTARVRISAGDAATTYAITIGGTTISDVGQTAPEDIVQELLGALDASAPINALVTYSTEASVPGGDVDTIVFKGKTPADYTITASATGGAGALVLTKDATTCAAKAYGLPGGKTPAAGQPQLPWCLTRNGDLGTLTAEGLTEGGLNVAGYKQLAVVIGGADGQVRVWVGPAIQE